MELFGYRFSMKKIRYKKATGFSAKHWTTAEKNLLLRLHGENIANEKIAKELNRTVPAICSMLTKLHKKTV